MSSTLFIDQVLPRGRGEAVAVVAICTYPITRRTRFGATARRQSRACTRPLHLLPIQSSIRKARLCARASSSFSPSETTPLSTPFRPLSLQSKSICSRHRKRVDDGRLDSSKWRLIATMACWGSSLRAARLSREFALRGNAVALNLGIDWDTGAHGRNFVER